MLDSHNIIQGVKSEFKSESRICGFAAFHTPTPAYMVRVPFYK